MGQRHLPDYAFRYVSFHKHPREFHDVGMELHSRLFTWSESLRLFVTWHIRKQKVRSQDVKMFQVRRRQHFDPGSTLKFGGGYVTVDIDFDQEELRKLPAEHTAACKYYASILKKGVDACPVVIDLPRTAIAKALADFEALNYRHERILVKASDQKRKLRCHLVVLINFDEAIVMLRVFRGKAIILEREIKRTPPFFDCWRPYFWSLAINESTIDVAEKTGLSEDTMRILHETTSVKIADINPTIH